MHRQPAKPISKAYLHNLGLLYQDAEVTPDQIRRPRKIVGKRKYPEAQQQFALVKWATLKGLLLVSIPNGGKRSRWAGAKERMLGLLPGMPDLVLLHPNKSYGAYFLEMKAPGAKPRPEQLAVMQKLNDKGYLARYFDNWELAARSIEEYLSEK